MGPDGALNIRVNAQAPECEYANANVNMRSAIQRTRARVC